jgi:nickel/cobalt transporter (NicO) family protein
VTGNGPALLAAAAGVGFGHAILPDHWVPLAVLGRTRRYPLGRVARLSGMAGVTHVLVSLVLGAIVIAVGLQFRSTVEHAQDLVIGAILIATGIGFALLELSGRGHTHGEHAHSHGDHADHGDHGHPHHDHQHDGRWSGLAALVIPFGAAASPDLTILPVFLAATTAGIGIAIGSLAIFAAVTIGTIVGLTLAAARGGYQLRGAWLDRWGNAVTALTLLAVGLLVLTGTI